METVFLKESISPTDPPLFALVLSLYLIKEKSPTSCMANFLKYIYTKTDYAYQYLNKINNMLVTFKI